MRRLPASAALQAFTVAGRSLSFSKAAAELNLTAGAISRQIRALEEQLGTALFRRHHKRVELTEAGRRFLDDIAPSLEHIAAAADRLRQGGVASALSIGAYPTFAIRWFIPRWGRFYDRHPEIDVRLTTSMGPFDFRNADYDAAMVVRPEVPLKGFVSHRVLPVELFPVCRPELARSIRVPADLARHTLLHDAPRPDDWPRWLAAAGVGGIDGQRGLRFESLNLALQAAIEGLGIAIGIGGLVRPELESGRLVRLFDVIRHSDRPFQFVYPEARANDLRLVAFRDWLLEEAAS
ncbi:transcriptional regulator GcvA [Oceanibacterium hippocampi]|uniref:Glycine cleavage system transcriptional activator n=1 Tax=Oceanibacterium hippocampi TaxID=745714 RepID=A0A1Y5TCK3_9PROT|nr:transcriptional regulator GcvA [Oceanibacterium hippocampi]SLN60655.1 Glycine cleavage system transcriptional activator [Oceanibacterium hippocampi]